MGRTVAPGMLRVKPVVPRLTCDERAVERAARFIVDCRVHITRDQVPSGALLEAE